MIILYWCFFYTFILPWPGEALALAALVAMSSQSDAEVVADESAAIVPACDGRAASKSSNKKVKLDPDASVPCWLCTRDVAPGDVALMHGHSLHGHCKNGMRSHNRLVRALGAEAAKQDAERMDKDPEKWKAAVLPLAVVGERPRALLAHHRDLLQEEWFNESAENKQYILLTKARFIGYMKQWEGYNTDSGSESFARRLDDNSSVEPNSDDEDRVKVRGNDTLTASKGMRSTITADGRRSRRNGRRHEAASSSRHRRVSASEVGNRSGRRAGESMSNTLGDRRRPRSRPDFGRKDCADPPRERAKSEPLLVSPKGSPRKAESTRSSAAGSRRPNRTVPHVRSRVNDKSSNAAGSRSRTPK